MVHSIVHGAESDRMAEGYADGRYLEGGSQCGRVGSNGISHECLPGKRAVLRIQQGLHNHLSGCHGRDLWLLVDESGEIRCLAVSDGSHEYMAYRYHAVGTLA